VLLHAWRQEHQLQKANHADHAKNSYLTTAMLFGAATYLCGRPQAAFTSSSTATALTFTAALALLEKLWPKAFADPDFLPRQMQFDQILLRDQSLQKSFEKLTTHRLALEIFASPLCPSFIYEALSWEERRASKDLLQDERKLVDTRHLISFTQVYTPAWVVDHLLEHTLGQILKTQPDLPDLSRKRLLDPALGGGVFLVQALDLLIPAYKNFGLSLFEAADRSLKNNLFGLDIDGTALAAASLSLILKLLSTDLNLEHTAALLPFVNLHLIDQQDSDGLGSLSPELRYTKGHALAQKYDVIVTNPPYLGRKLLPRPLKDKLKRHYAEASSDLSQAFLSMAMDRTLAGGSIGFITQGSFLHLANSRSLREKLLKEYSLNQVVELGSGVFPMLPGEKAFTALIVIDKARPGPTTKVDFLSLVHENDKEKHLKHWPAMEKDNVRLQSDFLQDSDMAINFRRPQAVSNLRNTMTKLADVATLKQGLATTDNGRFLRYIWEVQASDVPLRYAPYVRGEGGERWWSPINTLVLWEDNGKAIKDAVNLAYPYLKGNFAWVVKNEDYYFRAGLTFSFISKNRLSVRILDKGAIFDVGSSAIFVENESHSLALLAYLNSSLATAMAHDLNPTINFQVGDLKKLIIPKFSSNELSLLHELAAKCIEYKKRLFLLTSPLKFFHEAYDQTLRATGTESNYRFDQSTYLEVQDLHRQYQTGLLLCEAEIDSLVLKAVCRESTLSESDKENIEHFSQNLNLKSQVDGLDERAFALSRLCLLMLQYCLNNGQDKEHDQKVSVLHFCLQYESDALKFLAFFVKNNLDCGLDFNSDAEINPVLEYLARTLDSGKGLIYFIKNDLPRAFNDYFSDQPPLLIISVDDSIMILPAGALASPDAVAKRLQLSGAQPKIVDLIRQLERLSGLDHMRTKEILSQFRLRDTF